MARSGHKTATATKHGVVSPSMKHIIFDFDGTLADTLPHVLDIGEEVTGLIIDRKQIEVLRNKPMKVILKEFKIPLRRVPRYLIQGKKLLLKRNDKITPIKGIESVLKDLKKAGYDMQIVSSNSAPIIVSFLRRYKIEQYFSSVHGNIGLFSKAQALKKIIKRQNKQIGECIYIGDEVRDIEAAKKINLSIVAVTWGFNGEQILKEHDPNALAIKPSQLAGKIASL